MEVLQRVAVKPADSFVIVVKLLPNPLEDEQLEFSAFFKQSQFVNIFSQSEDWFRLTGEKSPHNRRGE